MRVIARLLALALFLVSAPAPAQQPAMRVTLIGTGGPEYVPDRLGIATLVEANGLKLLFDVGRGASQGLYESRINPKDIHLIFLTHLHNDHYEGLPELWLTPWFLLGRERGFDLYGPDGTRQMVGGMRTMFAHDLAGRANAYNRLEGLAITVHLLRQGVVFDEKGVRVTAFPVEHGDGNPAFGFRIDYAGHSVVLSGDTTFDENVVRHGTGADLIVHNVIAFSDRLGVRPEMHDVLAKLTTPEQAAMVFTRAAPKLAVYSHVVTKDIAATAVAGVIDRRTRAAGYSGPLSIGKDGMTITVGDSVQVHAPRSRDDLPALDSKEQTFP